MKIVIKRKVTKEITFKKLHNCLKFTMLIVNKGVYIFGIPV